MTKVLVQQARVRTNSVKDSVCKITVPVVTFSQLWESYPSGSPYIDQKTGKPPKGYENQCAIKVSVAIHGAGIEMKSFKGATVDVNGRRAAIVATELSAWLKLQPFCGLPQQPENVTGKDWQNKIKARTGIIYLADYWARTLREKEANTPSGDHIDLWNGSRLTATGWSFFSTLGRRIGINAAAPGTAWGFSDVRNAKTILFWEVK